MPQVIDGDRAGPMLSAGRLPRSCEVQPVDGAARPTAMATTPAASPSSPSMRLTALVMAMTQSDVSSGVHTGDSWTTPAKGTLNWYQVTPRK